MLTFLRKIRKSLIKSGSARRYLLYSIGEIALVVIGILIALQINNWNEWRKERKLEIKIFRELVENLQDNMVRLQSHKERCRIDNVSTDIILSVIDNNLPYDDSLDLHFPYALNPIDEGSFISYVGFESLKNVGFEIIGDDELKKEIIRLFELTYRELQARYDRSGKHQHAGIIDLHHQHFVRQSAEYRFTPLDFDNLVKDVKFKGWLNSIKGARGWVLQTIDQSLDETERILHLINEELPSDN